MAFVHTHRASKRFWFAALIASAVVTSFAPHAAHAYVTYQRLGYVSCSACHALPSGSGLLTAYGQSIQQTLAVFAPKDSDPAEKRWAAGLQTRVLWNTPSPRANPFLMQTEALAHGKLANRESTKPFEKISADALVGLNLQRGQSGTFASIPGGGNQLWVRRALVSTDWAQGTHTIQAGRDLSVSGLLIDDHTAYIRTRNKRTILDYPTQLRYIYQSERFQLMPYLAGPSYEESDDNREYGAGVRAEWALSEGSGANAIGATLYFGDAPVLSRTVGSLFVRLSAAHWNGLIAETIVTYRKVHAPTRLGSNGFDQQTLYVKPYVSPIDWVETGGVLETQRVSAPFIENVWRWGPTINLRLHEWISLLGDGRSTIRNDVATWSWYGQVFARIQI